MKVWRVTKSKTNLMMVLVVQCLDFHLHAPALLCAGNRLRHVSALDHRDLKVAAHCPIHSHHHME